MDPHIGRGSRISARRVQRVEAARKAGLWVNQG